MKPENQVGYSASDSRPVRRLEISSDWYTRSPLRPSFVGSGSASGPAAPPQPLAPSTSGHGPAPENLRDNEFAEELPPREKSPVSSRRHRREGRGSRKRIPESEAEVQAHHQYQDAPHSSSASSEPSDDTRSLRSTSSSSFSSPYPPSVGSSGSSASSVPSSRSAVVSGGPRMVEMAVPHPHPHQQIPAVAVPGCSVNGSLVCSVVVGMLIFTLLQSFFFDLVFPRWYVWLPFLSATPCWTWQRGKGWDEKQTTQIVYRSCEEARRFGLDVVDYGGFLETTVFVFLSFFFLLFLFPLLPCVRARARPVS